MDILRPYRPTKRLGQNFLQDQAIAKKIVSLADLQPNDVVLEPGAGYGSLTEHLRREAGKVIAVEKDRRLASILREKFRRNERVLVVQGDILKVPLPVYNKIVGTPPYNISSKLVMFLLSATYDTAHLVFQEEFANRIMAKPGTKNFGRLSITAQRRLNIVSLLRISRAVFNPSPRVDSALVRIEPKIEGRRNLDETQFNNLVRGLFVQRRRLLKSALTHYLELKIGRKAARDIARALNLPNVRVYEMSIQQIEDLSMILERLSPDEAVAKP